MSEKKMNDTKNGGFPMKKLLALILALSLLSL
ncbi:MAG: hypothetical protein FD166_3659, partial [Bacteroidetes bacterium]